MVGGFHVLSVHSFGTLAARSDGGGDTHTSESLSIVRRWPKWRTYTAVRLCACPLHCRCVLQECQNYEHCTSYDLASLPKLLVFRRVRSYLLRVRLLHASGAISLAYLAERSHWVVDMRIFNDLQKLIFR